MQRPKSLEKQALRLAACLLETEVGIGELRWQSWQSPDGEVALLRDSSRRGHERAGKASKCPPGQGGLEDDALRPGAQMTSAKILSGFPIIVPKTFLNAGQLPYLLPKEV